MRTFGYIMGAIAGLVLLIALAFAMELGGLQWERFFAPKHAAIKREVFKETRSYNEAKVQDLASYRLQYMKGDAETKEAIASTIRVMFADYELKELPSELGYFLKEIRGY